MSTYPDIGSMVGNTPIVELAVDIPFPIIPHVKLEGNNPTGSIKDRAAWAIIKQKVDEGITDGTYLLDASSGSFACSMAYFGKILGLPVSVVTNSKLTEDKRSFIEWFGAENQIHGDMTIQGNEFCKELISKNGRTYCFLDQLHNWTNPQVHYNTTGPEILKDLPEVNAIIFSLGSGGTLHGVAKYFREHRPQTKIIAVTAASGSKIPGAGAFVDGDYITPFIADAREKGYFDLDVEVESSLAEAHVKSLRAFGLFVGLQTGAVYEGMLQAANELDLSGDVLMISGDAGWKNMDKLTAL